MTRMARGKLSFIGHMESGPLTVAGPQLACHQQTSVHDFPAPHAFLYTDPMTSRSGYGMVFVEITIFSLFPKQKGGFSRNMFILPAVIAMVFGLIYILYRSGLRSHEQKIRLALYGISTNGKKAATVSKQGFYPAVESPKEYSTPAVQKISSLSFRPTQQKDRSVLKFMEPKTHSWQH